MNNHCERSSPIRVAEILCVGTELLLGDIVNTNAAFLSKELAALGISVYHQTVVGDHPERLRVALADAFEGHGRPAADLVVLSGGLGPTYDDLTKETVAAYFGRDMELHGESLSRIRDFFARTGRVMTPNNQKQAMMPTGCTVFPNDYGTAPALAVGDETRTAIMLPGPPAELEPIFTEQVTPFLRKHTEGVLISRNIHIMGLGESAVENMLHDLMVTAENPTVAPYCKSGEVRLRVTAKASDEASAAALCDEVVADIRRHPGIAPYVYGVDCDNAETALVRLFTERGLTVATAESCTGGMVGQRITARAKDLATAESLCDGMVEEIRREPRISPCIYGVDCHNVETALVRLCTERGLTVASAESCTGGMIGQRITAVPGASAAYAGGCITYTNRQKIHLLGVDPATIEAHTEVSAETAAEMAAGVRERLGTDVGLSTTGYAGPGGGTEENPVGTVYIGVATKDGVTTHRLYYRQKSRDYVREAAASRVMLEAIRVIL